MADLIYKCAIHSALIVLFFGPLASPVAYTIWLYKKRELHLAVSFAVTTALAMAANYWLYYQRHVHYLEHRKRPGVSLAPFWGSLSAWAIAALCILSWTVGFCIIVRLRPGHATAARQHASP